MRDFNPSEFVENVELYFDDPLGVTKACLDSDVHEEIAKGYKFWIEQEFNDPEKKFIPFSMYKGAYNEVLVLEESDFSDKIKAWVSIFAIGTEDIEFFNSKERDVNSVRATTIRYGADEKYFLGFKRLYPTNFLHHKNQYWIIPDNETFRPFNGALFGIQHSCDVLYYNSKVYCFNYNVLEKFLGFDSVVSAKANKSRERIVAAAFLDAETSDRINDKRFDRKLSKLPVNAKVFAVKPELIAAFAEKKFQLKIKDGKIVLKSQADTKRFLSLMNDELVKSELTNAEYLAEDKAEFDVSNMEAE